MNWSRCSRTLPTRLPLSLAVPATAPVDSSNVPHQRRAGEERRATIPLDDRYEDGTDERPRLTDAARIVRPVTPNGDTGSESLSGRSFETSVSAANDVERVEVYLRSQSGPGERPV